MKKISFIGLVWVALVLVVAFFSSLVFVTRPLQTDKPGVIVEALDQTIEPYAHFWHDETARRFPNAIVIIAHGGDFVQGQWIVGAGWQKWKHVEVMENVIDRYQSLYPGRTLVLVSCNPGHIALHGHPNVYYASSNVWVIPDRWLDMERDEAASTFWTFNTDFTVFNFRPIRSLGETRSSGDPDTVGSIFEFIEAR